MKLEKLNKELNDIFSTVEFEEDGGIHITGTDWYSDDLRIEFAIKTGIEGQNQLWEVQINGVREELIKSTLAEKLELFEDHPLLWAYSQRHANLYFGQPTIRPYELFASVYEIHLEESQKWIPFEKYINTCLSTIELCKSPTGLFAGGPLRLLEVYKKELEAHAMNPTILSDHNPKRRLNDNQVDKTEAVKVLIIGDSFIVAEAFDFKRV